MSKVIKQNNNQKINIHEEYLQYHEKFICKYGIKTIVLMQVGSFYESYGTETRGPNLFELSEILNIVCTRKDKSIKEINEKNPFMLGFNCVSSSKFIKILIDNQYTVVMIDQVTPAPNPRREVTNIYSPSTYIENTTTENKYMMVLYVETNQALNSTKSNISIGMCAIDSSIGSVCWYESHGSGIINDSESWEEAQRFYHFYRPVELIIYNINNQQTQSKLVNISEKIDMLPNQIVQTYNKINPEYIKLSYQNKLLKKIYPQCGMENPIEFFDLAKSPYAIISTISAFDYIYQHNSRLISELDIPKYFDEHKYMVLGNNSQYQLNIVDYYNWDKIDLKFHSLNAVVNSCSTSMGKRILKQRLCAPFTDHKTISKYYSQTDKILKLNIWEDLRNHLKEISDLDKLFRKLSIKFIQPYELYTIYKSLISGVKIIEIINKTEFKSDLMEIFGKSEIKQLIKLINQLENYYDIEQLKLSNLVEVKKSFYLKGIHEDLDILGSQIDNGIGMVEELSKLLNDVCGDISVIIKHNDADGYYLTTSKIRGEKLFNELAKQKTNLKLGTKVIKYNELDFKYLKHTCKISYHGLSSHSDEIDELYSQFDTLIKNYFVIDSLNWYNENIGVLKELVKMIVHIDIITNNAYTSTKYHYVKPLILDSKDYSSPPIYSKNLRHPIIERIIDYEYVPHNVNLDDNTRGNLIYGYNGVGKSSIMKGIGLNLIMAQCGLYVAADSFEYGIFDSLYTRISGNDNLFKGQSSFIVEMNELRTILKKATSKSLIIGDEVCRGTENLSANALVAASILKLSDIGAKFLFATHLHELVEIDEIKTLNTIKLYHLSVEKVGEQLIFNRKLKDGCGEQDYGTTVAQYILDDPIFINKAIEIKNQILEKNKKINTKLLSDKRSNYNKHIYMDNCIVCGGCEKLESHHINMQKDFINGIHNGKKHIIKDSEANLVVLCANCHDNLHGGNITISGLVKTSNGVKAII